MRSLQRYMPPKVRPHYIYTDNSKELIKACKQLLWAHDTKRTASPNAQFSERRREHRPLSCSQASAINGGEKR